jgi:hypothetical protein
VDRSRRRERASACRANVVVRSASTKTMTSRIAAADERDGRLEVAAE